jgi:hypothetical protein
MRQVKKVLQNEPEDAKTGRHSAAARLYYNLRVDGRRVVRRGFAAGWRQQARRAAVLCGGRVDVGTGGGLDHFLDAPRGQGRELIIGSSQSSGAMAQAREMPRGVKDGERQA